MITLALGQIVWGIAYRANDLTGGDNGLTLPARPYPFGLDIRDAESFYYFTLIVFAIALFFMWRFSRSAFGASLMGTRDQPRRMRMLGHNVWMIQWLTFVIAGFWGSVGGIMFVYYNLFLSPHVIALQQSAEILLMAILGGTSALTGPIVGAAIITLVKNVVSTYVERWNTLLGAIFVVVIIFMPFGLVPGCQGFVETLAQPQRTPQPPPPRPRRSRPNEHARARHRQPEQAVRRIAGDQGRLDPRHAGRAAADHRPERRRQDHAVQSGHRRPRRRFRIGQAVRPGTRRDADPEAGASRARAHLSDPDIVSARDLAAQRHAGIARA